MEKDCLGACSVVETQQLVRQEMMCTATGGNADTGIRHFFFFFFCWLCRWMCIWPLFNCT